MTANSSAASSETTAGRAVVRHRRGERRRAQTASSPTMRGVGYSSEISRDIYITNKHVPAQLPARAKLERGRGDPRRESQLRRSEQPRRRQSRWHHAPRAGAAAPRYGGPGELAVPECGPRHRGERLGEQPGVPARAVVRHGVVRATSRRRGEVQDRGGLRGGGEARPSRGLVGPAADGPHHRPQHVLGRQGGEGASSMA